jgi:hypothetical protein
MAECSLCRSTNDLYVWTIPNEPGYYGISPQLVCSKCESRNCSYEEVVPSVFTCDDSMPEFVYVKRSPTSNIFKDCKHKYDPLYDDFHLGLSTKRPPKCTSRSSPRFIDQMDICFECEKKFDIRKLHGYIKLHAHLWYQPPFHDVEAYYCQECLANYNQVNLDDKYKSYGEEFKQKYGRYCQNRKAVLQTV